MRHCKHIEYGSQDRQDHLGAEPRPAIQARNTVYLHDVGPRGCRLSFGALKPYSVSGRVYWHLMRLINDFCPMQPDSPSDFSICRMAGITTVNPNGKRMGFVPRVAVFRRPLGPRSRSGMATR